jgi:general stress protein CsbA
MKIKLLKVKTNVSTITYNYGDDYSDITKHIVTNTTDFEEVTDNEYYKILTFVQQFNASVEAKRNQEYFLIALDTVISVKDTISNILQKEKEEQIKREDTERERQKKMMIEKEKRAKTKLERIQKQLEKAKREAGIL